MIAAVVPIKPLGAAKGRLVGALDAPGRRALALAMLGDVLAALGAARAVARIGVISRDAATLELATATGADAICDRADDLNGALAQAANYYADAGAKALLVLHADLPLVTPAEIDRLATALDDAPGVVLAASRDGGTNALLARPPLALPFLFGHGSLARHIDAARARGLALHVVRSPGLELDIDRPADLRLLAASAGEISAQRLARSFLMNIQEKTL